MQLGFAIKQIQTSSAQNNIIDITLYVYESCFTLSKEFSTTMKLYAQVMALLFISSLSETPETNTEFWQQN